MRALRLVFAPLALLLRVLLRPFVLLRRQRAAEDGWLELELGGELREYPPAPRPRLMRLLRPRDDGPRVVVSELEALAKEITRDPRVRGLLVRLGPLGGGWATTQQVRAALAKVRDSGRKVVVHVTQYAGNREYLVATAATSLVTVPPAILAPVGSASNTLFLGELLEKVGVKVEVASAGRYKSAPDMLTRTTRSAPDREQAEALVRALDEALLGAVVEGRGLSREDAHAALDDAPYTGARAVARRLTDATVRDEDLPAHVQALDAREAPPALVRASDYLHARAVRPLVQRRRKYVGIVEVHGAIVDRGSPYLGMLERSAVEKVVVSDLRAALADRRVGAVVLHVNSRGGSVLASDVIYGAVARLAAEKPVIACFGDVAASGGYYVACGARAIVGSPLTVTGSIGVFGVLPTWPGLTERLWIHPDVVQTHKHASMADPWRARTDEERAHGQAEVEALYREFVALVARARQKTEAEVDALAQGRVWIGAEAHAHGLLDGLGGLDEAIDRAQTAAGGRFAERPALVRAKKPRPRPDPPEVAEKKAALVALATSALGELVDPRLGTVLLEALALRAGAPHARAWAWTPSGE